MAIELIFNLCNCFNLLELFLKIQHSEYSWKVFTNYKSPSIYSTIFKYKRLWFVFFLIVIQNWLLKSLVTKLINMFKINKYDILKRDRLQYCFEGGIIVIDIFTIAYFKGSFMVLMLLELYIMMHENFEMIILSCFGNVSFPN